MSESLGERVCARRRPALARAYAAALLAGDEVAAEVAIREAIDGEAQHAEIDEEIIAPALWLVGELWQRGEISVADEHLATEISLRVLALQREAQRVARARGGHRVMLAAPSGELHVVALRMIGNLLRDAGYDVVMLGADVPAEALAAAARRHEPDVICLSVDDAGGADRVLISMHEVQQERPARGSSSAGAALTSRVRSRPGVEVCRRVSDAVEAVDAWSSARPELTRTVRGGGLGGGGDAPRPAPPSRSVDDVCRELEVARQALEREAARAEHVASASAISRSRSASSSTSSSAHCRQCDRVVDLPRARGVAVALEIVRELLEVAIGDRLGERHERDPAAGQRRGRRRRPRRSEAPPRGSLGHHLVGVQMLQALEADGGLQGRIDAVVRDAVLARCACRP